jgi:eukaryotic-like serine/threonine-protein kinase
MARSTRATPPRTLRFADFELDPRAAELRRSGVRVRLQEQPFQVLALLLQHPGEIVTREEVRQHLWPSDTFVDFDNSLNTAINKIREALGDSVEDPHFVETLPRRGYRFIAPVEKLWTDVRPIQLPQRTSETAAIGHPIRRVLLVTLLLGLTLAGAAYWAKQRSGHHLTEKDTIVLADFVNNTGDAIFDDILKQALAVQLRQSPFLSFVPDPQARETLRFMGHSPDERVTGGVAREICERQGAKAVLQGSIKSLGSHYVLSLNALNCLTGESLAEEQAEARSKEDVLTALGGMASRLRGKLGESLAAVEKYDTPVLQATTSSLEALKAYSLGVEEDRKLNDIEAIPFFKRAIELDPNFAVAYVELSSAYSTVGEDELARESVRKAFALRERVSEHERLYISAIYQAVATGDLEETIAAYQLWGKTYPRESLPHSNLAYFYNVCGFFDKGLEESTAALRVVPHSALGYVNLARADLGLNRWREARAALERLIADGEDDFKVYSMLYLVAFTQGDLAAMQKYLDLGKHKAEEGDKPFFQLSQARAASFYGKLRMARELSESARQTAEAVGFKQNVGAMAAEESLWEAQLGNLRLASERAEQALAKARGVNVEARAAVALAMAGRTRSAERIADNLARRYPEDTVLNAVSVPLIRSTNALERGNANRAIELLKVSEPYELGFGDVYYLPLMPTYTRGQAYLKIRDGSRAVAEFQKILDHHGVMPDSINYALAHLGLGRAYTVSGDEAKARSAYQDFFVLWKDADPDIPILHEAKAEYERLK